MPDSAFRLRLHEAVSLYIYAMGYDPAITDGRLRAWANHRLEPKFTAVAAIQHPESVTPKEALLDTDCSLVGIAYCHQGRPEQWWHTQVRAGMAALQWPLADRRAVLSNYTELAEIHVHPDHQGAGIGEQMLRTLLAGRTEDHVLLSTPEVAHENNRAWSLYRRVGFTDVLRNFEFAGDSRPFAVLGAKLPLDSPPPTSSNTSR
ncbi:GNAT family N-acetyltransferase [Corynebacterium sp. H113]|uniref:GNAT family N-acetyltransferase n=1 Tax=Corynebacterium sp. H113 TaxID=3133419 RepID=UPI0030A2605B